MAMLHRDDAQLETQLAAWVRTTMTDRREARVADLRRPSSGWSNETVLFTLLWHDERGEHRERLVLRLPSVVPSFPVYDLGAQARVLDALARAGIPTARVVAYEADDSHFGAPALLLEHVDGRAGPETPGVDPWITDAPAGAQRAVQTAFLEVVAAIHRVDWRALGLGEVLRGAAGDVRAEVEWWREYVDWATEGAPPRGLADAVGWCADHAPANPPDPALCWGDARIGNLLFDEQRAVVAVLDWELATLGPPESDLGWYLALDALTARFTGAVPGFRDRAGAIAHYEARLGRAVADLAFHEAFALVRSAAISDRQARIARSAGVAYPGVAGDDNPVLRALERHLERLG
jgi:aminoglycoside phosphotransferase (APT) family kinase protein